MVFKPFGPYGPAWPSRRVYRQVRERHIRKALGEGKSVEEALKEWHQYFREWAKRVEKREGEKRKPKIRWRK